jgi:hypothetical protein
VHTIDASSPAERDEWLSVLRKHAAHHSIRNVYDVSKRKLAQGDISEVYSGKDLLTNKKKALKILLKDQIDDVSVAAVGGGNPLTCGSDDWGSVLNVLRVMPQDDELFADVPAACPKSHHLKLRRMQWFLLSCGWIY